MTKPELLNKYPILQKPETITMLGDIANHMRRAAPFLGMMNKPMDATEVMRHAGRMEGWATCLEIIQNIHLMPPAPAQQTTERPYTAPQVLDPEVKS